MEYIVKINKSYTVDELRTLLLGAVDNSKKYLYDFRVLFPNEYKWCVEHFGECYINWRVEKDKSGNIYNFKFENENDALLFKLTWR